jgi:hypothetical protein
MELFSSRISDVEGLEFDEVVEDLSENEERVSDPKANEELPLQAAPRHRFGD